MKKCLHPTLFLSPVTWRALGDIKLSNTVPSLSVSQLIPTQFPTTVSLSWFQHSSQPQCLSVDSNTVPNLSVSQLIPTQFPTTVSLSWFQHCSQPECLSVDSSTVHNLSVSVDDVDPSLQQQQISCLSYAVRNFIRSLQHTAISKMSPIKEPLCTQIVLSRLDCCSWLLAS